ncbi:hypothetical protein [Vibrio diabolicus]|uniref:hypothetical protein n=1 Tax=Vibrio diabolicus TaxID=50719 RepID=UPI00215E6F04|nr:hypothetical protein [Vibrio diabolicus]MCS0416090.1 hypothetical protein [Vibrio diabolicus]
MKIKLLTASVAAVLLAGCGSDSDPEVKTYSVQAYDPAVIDMKVTYTCGDLTGEADELTTNYKGMVGYARISHVDVVSDPEDCSFVLSPTATSRDASNGKPISTTYKIPQGLAQADTPVTGSPFTTLVTDTLEEGAIYTPEVAEQVFDDLGLDINAMGVSVNDLLRNTESVVKQLDESGDAATKALATKLVATANVVSDVIKANPTASPKAISVAAKAITEDVIAANPNYPENDSGDVIYVTIPTEDTQKVVADVQEAIDNDIPLEDIEPEVPQIPDAEVGEPIEPEDPPAPGTGATGGN